MISYAIELVKQLIISGYLSTAPKILSIVFHFLYRFLTVYAQLTFPKTAIEYSRRIVYNNQDERGIIMQTDFSNIKCIAFDLDDTLLANDKTISARTLTALSAVTQKGIAVIPVTGRAYSTLPSCLKEIQGLSLAVTSNGAAIYDLRTGSRVHDWLLEAKDVRAIMRAVGNFFVEGQLTYEAFVDGVAYASADFIAAPTRFGVPESAVSYIRQTRRPDRFMIDFIFEHAKNMDSLGLILKDAGLCRMIENVIRRSAQNVYITSSVPYRMEISHADSGKAAGLGYVLDQLEISADEVLAFGDGESDAEMLRFAGIGAAMKNACESCKDASDYVTDYSNQEDGIADFIEKNLL